MKRDYPTDQPPFPIKPRFNWRHQYDTARDQQEGDTAILKCEDESLTVQSFAQDADLNVLAKRFGINAIPTAPLDAATFRDTTQDPDLRQILDYRIEAQNQFRGLPAKLRRRFHDNPAELWQFLQDPDNAEEAIRLGLLTAAPATSGTPTASPSTAPATNATSHTDTAPKGTPKGAPQKTENPPNPPRGADT